jgi:homoserine O-acetyltransferase/O-succinyltransferase
LIERCNEKNEKTMTKIYTHNIPFILENGSTINGLELCYTIYGNLNNGNKIVWVFHALTANSDPQIWWQGLVGEGCYFNEKEYTIICVNMPGSCYGSTGPLSINPITGLAYYHTFPVFTVVDMVHAFELVQQHLNINKIHIALAPSMGGQHLLQWAAMNISLFETIIPISCNAIQSAWGLAIDAAQRLAIEADTTWKENNKDAGSNGMKAARAFAMLHYRTYDSFESKNNAPGQNAETYQRHHAKKITERFNAFSYYNLSLSRNTHNVANLLKNITAKTLIIGFDTDNLFPIQEQIYLAENIPNAAFCKLTSPYGHDSFLVETALLTKEIEHFLAK